MARALTEKGILQTPELTLFRISLAVHYVITNTEKTPKEIWAILYHYASTADENTCIETAHQVTEVGCSYQKNIANGTSTNKPVKYLLSEATVKLVTTNF